MSALTTKKKLFFTFIIISVKEMSTSGDEDKNLNDDHNEKVVQPCLKYVLTLLNMLIVVHKLNSSNLRLINFYLQVYRLFIHCIWRISTVYA